MSSFINILKQSYKVLNSLKATSLEEEFDQEAKLRETFNIQCISFIDAVCKNCNKIQLPKYYSCKSIVSEILVGLIESHRKNRLTIIKISKFILNPLSFKKNKSKLRNNVEEDVFVFLSMLFVFSYCIKRLLVNTISVFSSLKIEGGEALPSSGYILCVGFPWYSYVKHSKHEENEYVRSEKKLYGLADYIKSSTRFKDNTIISIGEYESSDWGSSQNLHKNTLIKKHVANRKVANPVILFEQIKLQIINAGQALNIASNLKFNGFLDKLLISLSIIKYCTSAVDTQKFLSDLLSSGEPVTLLYNANSFYSFPWYAAIVEEKYHYMYADNCCYFPFSYFSPSIDTNRTPSLIKNSTLFYGFLEWPIFSRIVGEKDIGYQGVSRLSHSIQKQYYRISTTIGEEQPFQLGSIQRFFESSDDQIENEIAANELVKTVLFLDGITRDIDNQIPIFDVPTTFLKPEVTKIYYDSLFDFIKNHDVTIHIRSKYQASNDLLNAVNVFLSAYPEYSCRLKITSSRAPLQEILSSINPSIVLVRPLSSTYLFSSKLGYQSYYYLPKYLQNIFDKMLSDYDMPKLSNQNDWISEDGLNNILLADGNELING